MRNILALLMAVLLLSAPHTALAIGNSSGMSTAPHLAQFIPGSGSIVLAAASAKFKICKIRCKKKHRCGPPQGTLDPERRNCKNKRSACISSCPK